MAAMACISVMMSSLFILPYAWIILRALAGFAFAGAAMIVEGWLVERSEAKSRGMIFGTYTMVNLFASTAGQMVIAIGTPETFQLFTVAAIFYVVALLPTALTKTQAPCPFGPRRTQHHPPLEKLSCCGGCRFADRHLQRQFRHPRGCVWP